MRSTSALLLVFCAACERPPPAFGGASDSSWLAIAVDIGHLSRDELVDGFVARARDAACKTDQLGPSARAWERGGLPHPQGGLLARRTVAVIAYCAQGDLALFIHDDDRGSYGCRRPVDEETCRARLQAVLAPAGASESEEDDEQAQPSP